MGTDNNSKAKSKSESKTPNSAPVTKSNNSDNAPSAVTAPAPNNRNGSSGNNSDNSSGMISLGNNSFGFNFDSEEGMSNPSPPDSDDGKDASTAPASTTTAQPNPSDSTQPQQQNDKQEKIETVSQSQRQAHNAAAAQTVSKLHSIASQVVMASEASGTSNINEHSNNNDNATSSPSTSSNENSKRKASSVSSNGYNSDDEGSGNSSEQPTSQRKKPQQHQHQKQQKTDPGQSSSATTATPQVTVSSNSEIKVESSSNIDDDNNENPKKKTKIDDAKREERNAREKERSYRIAAQINELRTLLSNGGVIVPKGTKNAVLTEAANYIKMLQEHQYKSEIHRQQLIQQMQMIGSGAIGQQAANAIRHVAAQNGVWSLGNFGGVPPRTAVAQDPNGQQETQVGSNQQDQNQDGNQSMFSKSIDEHDYRFIFNSCSIPMAIASMGGAFIDCNQIFSDLSQYSKQELCSLTIFNLTARSDLQHAFDLVSQMITPPNEHSDNTSAQASPSCILRGNMKNRDDLGLNIALIRDEEGIAKCFCVSLIKNPSSPFDTTMPVHATPSLLTMQQQEYQLQDDGKKEQGDNNNMTTPAFMTG